MAYDIQDFDEIQIYVTDGWREWYIPKFRIDMVVEGDFCYVYWSETEKGDKGERKLLSLDYNDVTFGYLSPSSAGEVEIQINSYIVSAWTNIPIPPTPDLDAVLTAGNDGGALEITNIADGSALTSAATFGQVMFTLYYGHGVFNYADSTTYHISGNQYTPASTGTNPWGYYVPFNCKITAASILIFQINAIGSNEDISVYVRVNNTTDYLIQTRGIAQRDRLFSSTSLNGGSGISLSAGDYVTVKIVCPNWLTNPTQSVMSGNLFLVRQ